MKNKSRSIESLLDIIYSGYRDDADLLYSSRKRAEKEIKKNIRLLESVLSREERERLVKWIY